MLRAVLVFVLAGAMSIVGAALAPIAADAEPPSLQMLDDVNRVRSEAGLAPLAESDVLEQVAAERSADMAGRGYFSHTTPDGLTAIDMLNARGIGFHQAGENLAWNTYDENQASRIALQGFLDSPPHRANVLNPAYSQIGVGVARDGNKTLFTVLFAG